MIGLNKNGNNANIVANILPDDEMRKIGFTDLNPEVWYFCKRICKEGDISFSVMIPKDGSDVRIDVLDECFLQPYDYQYILRKKPDFKFALQIREAVEDWMTYLHDNGVLTGHNRYDYI